MADEPSAPGYMLLYGSLMTLLMTFFILLVSMGTQEQNKKMDEVVTSIKSAFGAFGTGGAGLLDGSGSIVVKPDFLKFKLMRILRTLKLEDLQGVVMADSPQKPGQPIRVSYDEVGRIHILVKGDWLFTHSGSEFSQEGKRLLQKMLALYFDTPYGITIEGYAGGFGGERDWKRAFDVAMRVMKYLREQGVPFESLYPQAKRDKNIQGVAVAIIIRESELVGRV